MQDLIRSLAGTIEALDSYVVRGRIVAVRGLMAEASGAEEIQHMNPTRPKYLFGGIEAELQPRAPRLQSKSSYNNKTNNDNLS